MKVTEAMVRRFCHANAIAEYGERLDCDGEYHKGIRAGLEAVLAGKGEPCRPRYCRCEKPTPIPHWEVRCGNDLGKSKCYGVIPRRRRGAR